MTLGRKTAKTNVASFAELNRTLTDTFSELDLFNVSMFQKKCHCKATCIFIRLHVASKETDRANLCRQLDGLKLERSYLDGFLSHLQNEVKERLIEEEANLHVYSSNDVDMLVPHIRFTYVHGCHRSTFVMSPPRKYIM